MTAWTAIQVAGVWVVTQPETAQSNITSQCIIRVCVASEAENWAVFVGFSRRVKNRAPQQNQTAIGASACELICHGARSYNGISNNNLSEQAVSWAIEPVMSVVANHYRPGAAASQPRQSPGSVLLVRHDNERDARDPLTIPSRFPHCPSPGTKVSFEFGEVTTRLLRHSLPMQFLVDDRGVKWFEWTHYPLQELKP